MCHVTNFNTLTLPKHDVSGKKKELQEIKMKISRKIRKNKLKLNKNLSALKAF